MAYLLLAGHSSSFESGAHFNRPTPPPPSYHQLPSNLVPSSKAGGLILPPAYDSIKQNSPKNNQRTMLPLPADRSVANTRKGSFGFGKKAVELSMTVADNLVFLYPNSAEGSRSDVDAVGQRPRATFIVSITLSIAKGIPPPPPIEKMTVELRGLETLGFPTGLEQNIIKYAQQEVEDACCLELVPGQAYKWEVPIEIPHNVAPYERMKFGRVFQKMRVQLEWQNKSWLSKYKNLLVERDVWITCIPRISNMLDYARTHRTMQDHLGPMSIHIRSHHLTVGSYLRLGLYLPLIPFHTLILRLELATIQSTFLHSRKRPGAVFRDCTPERIPFLTVEGDEFRAKMQNHQVDWIARIPSCDRIRPSTLSGSKDAAIRLSHKIEIRIYFSTNQTTLDKPLVYSAQWPVILPSCAARWRSLKLPSYSKYDPSPVPDGTPLEGEMDPNGVAFRGRLRSHRDQTDCSCGIPLEKILKFEDEFEEAQRTCLTQLMTQELLSGSLSTTTTTTSDTPFTSDSPLQPVRSSEIVFSTEEDEENIYNTNDTGIDLSLCPDEEEVRQQKAAQAYIPEPYVSSSSSSNQ